MKTRAEEKTTVVDAGGEAAPDETVRVERRDSRRSRRLWLTVHLDGRVVLTVPPGTGERAVDRFLAEQAAWLAQKCAYVRRFKDDVFLPAGRRNYLRRKEEARVLVRGFLAEHAPRYGFSWGKVFVKDLRRNWGSCSELGNLNFNYKIALLPRRLAEYVVVHELCHLAAFDHTPRFWELVALTCPDHQALRKELRKYHA